MPTRLARQAVAASRGMQSLHETSRAAAWWHQVRAHGSPANEKCLSPSSIAHGSGKDETIRLSPWSQPGPCQTAAQRSSRTAIGQI